MSGYPFTIPGAIREARLAITSPYKRCPPVELTGEVPYHLEGKASPVDHEILEATFLLDEPVELSDASEGWILHIAAGENIAGLLTMAQINDDLQAGEDELRQRAQRL